MKKQAPEASPKPATLTYHPQRGFTTTEPDQSYANSDITFVACVLPPHSTPIETPSSSQRIDSPDLAFMSTVSISSTWYADSAATRHMTGNRHWFSTYTTIPDGHWLVQGISAEPLYAHGIGTITIDRLVNGKWLPGHLTEVIHIPGLNNNLFSITH